MIKKLFITTYMLTFLVTYGHFWNNNENYNDDVEWKAYMALMVSAVHPLYWSTVVFEVDDD